MREAAKYAEELNLTLPLDALNPACVTTEGKVVTAARAGNLLKKSQELQFSESEAFRARHEVPGIG